MILLPKDVSKTHRKGAHGDLPEKVRRNYRRAGDPIPQGGPFQAEVREAWVAYDQKTVYVEVVDGVKMSEETRWHKWEYVAEFNGYMQVSE